MDTLYREPCDGEECMEPADRRPFDQSVLKGYLYAHRSETEEAGETQSDGTDEADETEDTYVSEWEYPHHEGGDGASDHRDAQSLGSRA